MKLYKSEAEAKAELGENQYTRITYALPPYGHPHRVRRFAGYEVMGVWVNTSEWEKALAESKLIADHLNFYQDEAACTRFEATKYLKELEDGKYILVGYHIKWNQPKDLDREVFNDFRSFSILFSAEEKNASELAHAFLRDELHEIMRFFIMMGETSRVASDTCEEHMLEARRTSRGTLSPFTNL